jgi:hypothetical protein
MSERDITPSHRKVVEVSFTQHEQAAHNTFSLPQTGLFIGSEEDPNDYVHGYSYNIINIMQCINYM